MGGGKYIDVHEFDAITLAEQEGLIHSLCTDARVEMEGTEEYIKNYSVLIGKLLSDVKFLKCETDTTNLDFEAHFHPDLKVLNKICRKQVPIAKLHFEKANKLSKRCLKETKAALLAITDATNGNIDDEEFFELYGVIPDFIRGYVFPRLLDLNEMILSILTTQDELLQKMCKLLEIELNKMQAVTLPVKNNEYYKYYT